MVTARLKLTLWQLLLALALICPAAARADETCNEALAFEAKVNRDAPRMIDAATELVQIRVNCDQRSLTYVKRLLIPDTQLAPGWRERKQRQYALLHCNARGIASNHGWTARDEIHDMDFNHLLTLIATPADCAVSDTQK